MECPNGWTECELCLYCFANRCYYEAPLESEGEPEPEPVSNIDKPISGFWRWWGKSTPPNIHETEILPPRGGGIKRGGSKSVKRKKSPKGNKVYVDKWNGL